LLRINYNEINYFNKSKSKLIFKYVRTKSEKKIDKIMLVLLSFMS